MLRFVASPFVPLKIGLDIMPRPLEFAGYRFFLAGFFIALFYALSRRGKGPDKERGGYFTQVRRNFPKIALISVFHTSLLYTFFYMGQMRVEAAVGALVVGSQPLFVAVFAHVMRRDDRLSWRKTAAILLGLAGLVIIASGKVSATDFLGWTPPDRHPVPGGQQHDFGFFQRVDLAYPHRSFGPFGILLLAADGGRGDSAGGVVLHRGLPGIPVPGGVVGVAGRAGVYLDGSHRGVVRVAGASGGKGVRTEHVEIPHPGSRLVGELVADARRAPAAVFRDRPPGADLFAGAAQLRKPPPGVLW